MPIYKVQDKSAIAPLFAGWPETFIWSCLQDCMGVAYADGLERPKSAKIILGDFCCVAGEVNEEIIRNHLPDYHPAFLIMVPQNDAWDEAIGRVLGEKATRRMRYATQKENPAFDSVKLRELVATLPAHCELKMIDRALYRRVLALPWAVDLCGNFPTYEAYEQNGLGMVVLEGGEIVAGASSYTFYRGGIEIEIDTRADKRRRGFATVCGAQLILACLERDLYPSWDAHNPASLALAEKLGYRFDREYPAYEIIGY